MEDTNKPERVKNKRTSSITPAWARVISVISLVAGIVGVALAWIPLAGRFVALVCSVVALLTGALGVRSTVAGAAASRHAIAIAGLTLGFVCLFEALRLTGCSALGGAATDAVLGLVN